MSKEPKPWEVSKMRHKLYQRESGMALIIVLLIVMAIAMMASSYVLSSRRDIRTTQVIKTLSLIHI